MVKMASEASTRQKLHSILDDMELISKELIEQLAMPKAQRRPDAPDTEDLMQLLIEKDSELKEILKTAEEQEKVQKVMDKLRSEVNKRDIEVRQLQIALKEAEIIMATAVYQAKRKLSAVRQAQSNKVMSEDLIKYAHRISASNAVAAPPTWGPGDPRRPYPTDLEMRHSFLTVSSLPDTTPSSTPGAAGMSKLYAQAQPNHPPQHQPHPGTPSSSSSNQQHYHTPGGVAASSHSHPHHHHQQQAGSSSSSSSHHPPPFSWAGSTSSSSSHHPTPFSWPPSQDSSGPGTGAVATLGSTSSSSGHHHSSHIKDEDEVELMSSDSSSSSSSDE